MIMMMMIILVMLLIVIIVINNNNDNNNNTNNNNNKYNNSKYVSRPCHASWCGVEVRVMHVSQIVSRNRALLGIHYRGVQSEEGAVDGGSIM